MNYANALTFLVFLPLVAISIALVTFVFQAMLLRRRVEKHRAAIDEVAGQIAWRIDRDAKGSDVESAIRDLRQKYAGRRDPVLQLLLQAAGMPAATLVMRVDGLVHRSFGGTLSTSVRTTGNLAVLVALAVTSGKILLGLIQMGGGDPKATTTLIGQALASTVFGASLAALATLTGWVLVDPAVDRIYQALVDAAAKVDDTCRSHANSFRSAAGLEPHAEASRGEPAQPGTTNPKPFKGTGCLPSANPTTPNNGGYPYAPL